MTAKKKNDNIPDGLKSAFKALQKMNEFSSTLSENALSNVTGYIDTGSMALNAIVSGSLYGGIPQGRITGLVGPSGSGKTLILNKIIANAQKKDSQVWGNVWDTENAYEKQMVVNVGGNPNQIKVNPVGTIEDCRNQISAFLDNIIPEPSLHGKIVIGIDSLGNLASEKEVEDTAKGKSASDMGGRAKALRSMLRVLTHKCAISNTTLVFTNHIYENSGQMFPSLLKTQSGGLAPLYLSSLLVQLAVTQEKKDTIEHEEFIPLANRVKGINMRALIAKNRFIPPFLETNMYLNFKSGLYKYSGLIEMAEAYNVIQKQGNRYFLGEENIGFKNSFKNDDEIWKKILTPLEEELQKDLMFSNESSTLKADLDEELYTETDENQEE